MKILDPRFEIGGIVEPTPDAAIKPASRVGRVESRAWTEFRDQLGYWRYTIRWPAGGTSSEDAKHLQSSDAIGCDLKVVVSGVPVKVETTTTATVDELIERVIFKAGAVTRQGTVEWELRTEDGRRLVHLVGDAEPVDGETTLFCNPEVGSGGDSVEATIVASSDPSQVGRTGRVPVEALGAPWQGTPPAEGTRRKLIFDGSAARRTSSKAARRPPPPRPKGSPERRLVEKVAEAVAEEAVAEVGRPIDDFDLVDAARAELLERVKGGTMAIQRLVFLVWRLGR